MKKIIIAITAALLIGISIYQVNNYNKNSLAIQKQAQGNSTTSVSNGNNKKDTTGDKFSSAVKIKAEDFKLKDLNGNEVSLSDFRGKKVFLNFWATWCPPCRGEMPEIEELYQATKTSDLVILTVNLGKDQKTVKTFADNNKYNFKILLDSNNKVASSYNISSIPTSYFIDEEGYIKAKNIGAMSLDDMKFYIDSIKD